MGRVIVRGLDGLLDDLDDLGDGLADLRDVDQAAAARIAQTGSGRAPRRTGRLAGSLTVTTTDAGGAAVTSPLPYAAPIHFGWPAQGISPHPFATDAAQQLEPVLLDLYDDHIDRLT